jgi:hypothetical protein
MFFVWRSCRSVFGRIGSIAVLPTGRHRSGENLFFLLRKQFVSAAVVLVLCAHASALPTMADCEHRLSVETDAISVCTSKTYTASNDYAQPTSLAFADAAQVAQVFSPPTDISAYFASPQNFAYSTTQQDQGDNDVKNLPAVPGAVLMVIVGFLCISLVRDRKVWVSALVLIVVLSQAGVRTLPKLTARLAQGRLISNQAATLAVVNPIRVGNSFNWFRNLGNRNYIGLLRRLAGSPDGDQYTITTSHPFILVQQSFNPLADSLAERFISIVYFSPAFIFGNLARSPPILD